MLALKSTRLSQAGATQVDWGNPITRGMEGACSNVQTSFNAASQTFATLNSTRTDTVGGVGAGTIYTFDSYDSYTGIQNDLTRGSTIMVIAQVNGPTSTPAVMGPPISTSGINIKLSGVNLWRVAVFSGSQINVFGPAAIPGKPQVVIGTCDNSNGRIYVDGVLGGTTAAGAPTANPVDDFRVGRSAGSSASENIIIYAWATWARAISDAEASSLGANPWQLFR